MHTLRKLTAAGVVLFLAAACDAAPAPTSPADAPPPPALSFTNGPANPSPYVIRFDGVLRAGVWFDPDRGLLSVHHFDPDDAYLCDGSSGPGTVELQAVDRLAQIQKLNLLFRERETAVTVYASATFPGFDGLCDLFASADPIGQGVADFLSSDHDLGDVFVLRFAGRLAGGDGGRIQYSEVQAFVEGRGWLVEDIILSPVGGS